MITVTFSAFSFLQAKLKRRGSDPTGSLEVPDSLPAAELAPRLGLERRDVEAVFVNGKVVPDDTVLNDGDRVALVPPGTPGPYRALLGMVRLTEPPGDPTS